MDSQKHTGLGVRAEALTIPELEQSKAAVLNAVNDRFEILVAKYVP